MKNKKNLKIIMVVVVAILTGSIIGFGTFKLFTNKDDKVENNPVKEENNPVKEENNTPIKEENNTSVKEVKKPNRMSGNSLEDFDLYFLQLENKKKNMIYSPLSIKYALEMLGEGTSGNSKTQLDTIIGDYQVKKYNNSSNISFANTLFIKEDYQDNIKDSYVKNLKNKYNAEVIYDSFKSPDNLNSWVKGKTFGLINNLFGDVSENVFVLTNALAIDMEWKYPIQPMLFKEWENDNDFWDNTDSYINFYDEEHTDSCYGFIVKYSHEKYDGIGIGIYTTNYYSDVMFNNKKIKSVEIGASINKYDIVNILGEENIRKTVGNEYEKWVKEDVCELEEYEDTNTFLDKYIKQLNSNYKDLARSTDFRFYVDDDVKLFAKELKEYDGTTLEYIGIMPQNEDLDKYVENIDAKSLNKLISNLKQVELDTFEEGKITKITGTLPLFKFDYNLNLMEDLKKLGVTDVFDSKKADLSSLTSDGGVYIDQVSHKANIEFANDGIKAAATTMETGAGDASCGFDYLYDVPVVEIDLTFDKPYMFIIRDKDSNEVWFVGTVYEPTENTQTFGY